MGCPVSAALESCQQGPLLKSCCTGWAFHTEYLEQVWERRYLYVGRGIVRLFSLLGGSGVPVRIDAELWVHMGFPAKVGRKADSKV